MTKQEQSVLDYWLAVNIMGYAPTDNPDEYTVHALTLVWMRPGEIVDESFPRPLYGESYFSNTIRKHSHSWHFYNPTTNPILSEKILSEILRDGVIITRISVSNGWFNIVGSREYKEVNGGGETISEAICSFAYEIYRK